MEANGLSPIVSDIVNPEAEKYSHEALEVSSEVDTTLACCSEKLANLENFLLHFVEETNNIKANGFENDDISEELIEKTSTFDLLSAMLNFELREVDDAMGNLQDLIVGTLRKISSCENSTEILNGLVRKLHDSEELLKQYQDRVLEMKIQLAKLQMTSFSSEQHDWKRETRKIEQRGTIRMLEKSLAREMELEKKLNELKRNEQDLNIKVRLVEQVAVCMEEAAEVAWGRFLEADNTSEVLMGLSKDTLAKLHLVQLNLSSSTKREEEKNHKLQDYTNQLHANESLIQKLNNEIAHLVADNAEVKGLREKVQKLEENLEIDKSKLEEANALNKTSRKRLEETESEMEALREKIYAAENRAESAEEKATHLTDSNIELSEEVDFLKGTNDNNTKKVSMLEKQLRELDIQLQHSRALSEASQEQQNMLYSAIWDMETLIDELKQKVAKSESKNESVEERCVILSETNSDINKELEFLRCRVGFLEKSLNEAALEKKSSAKDISIRSSRIMDTVMQLAMERERIQKQLISCTKENKLLRETLQKERKNAFVIPQDNRNCDEKELQSSRLDSAESESGKTFAVTATEIPSESLQVEKLSVDTITDDTETGASSSANRSTNLVLQLETERLNYRRTFIFVAILVVVLSSLAAHLFQKKVAIL